MAGVTERISSDLLASIEGLFLDDELAVHQREKYADLLRRSEVKSYKRTSQGLVLYFKNGRRIQFRAELLGQVRALLASDHTDSKAGTNRVNIGVLCQRLGL